MNTKIKIINYVEVTEDTIQDIIQNAKKIKDNTINTEIIIDKEILENILKQNQQNIINSRNGTNTENINN